MKRSTLLALSLGTLFTFLAVGIDSVGGFVSWERQSIDYRFRAVPRPAQPMSEQIVHVDIDDGALDRFGLWPWDRATLGSVIDELRKAGAKTIALDLTFSDRFQQDYRKGRGADTEADVETDSEDEPESDEKPQTIRWSDDDHVFAIAMRKAACVLALDTPSGQLHHATWNSEDGQEALGQLLDVLAADIQLDPNKAATAAGLSASRTRRFQAQELEFRRQAAWHALDNATEPVKAFEDFERLVAPNLGEHDRFYAERPILESVWTQSRAWTYVQPHLMSGESSGTFKDKAPLEIFAAAASSFGFVTVKGQEHSDGFVREMRMKLPAPGGFGLQFGAAAVTRQLDLNASDVVVTDDSMTIGSTRLPLRDGKLWLNWPTSETTPAWLGLLRQHDEEHVSAGHMSIRELVEIALSRHTLSRNRDRVGKLSRDILAVANLPYEAGEEMSDENQAAIQDEAEFTLEDAPKDSKESHVVNCREWAALTAYMTTDEAAVETAEHQLQSQIKGKLVFVGWTGTGTVADFVPTAVGSKTPGVVVHAVIANMVLNGRSLYFPPQWQVSSIVLLFGLLCTLIAARFPAVTSAILAGVALVTYVGIAGVWLFGAREVIMPMVAPLTAGATSWVACTALQAAISQRERKRITAQFKARVSAQLVDHLVNNPDAVSMTGEEREMTVMFGDLANFTTVSEKLGGQTTVSTLNRYLGALANVLIDHGAYLNKFLGDGLMAFWSAFAVEPDQAFKACHAALKCHSELKSLNDDPKFEHIPKLGLRLGIATGKVVVGDCGAPPELNDYTVIGDAVNLASRLESANKQFGTEILIDGRTRQQIGDVPVRLRPLGHVVVVGQTIPVEVFEVLPAETPDELIEISTRAIEAYAAGNFAEASEAFDELEDRFGKTKIADLFRRSIAKADGEFDGALHLSEK